MRRPPCLSRASMARAARSIAGRALRTAATAVNWPSIMASRMSDGSQTSISEYLGLARSVSIKPVIPHESLVVPQPYCATKLTPHRVSYVPDGNSSMNTIEAQTGMAGEFREAPEAVRRQAEALAEPLRGLVRRLSDRPP